MKEILPFTNQHESYQHPTPQDISEFFSIAVGTFDRNSEGLDRLLSIFSESALRADPQSFGKALIDIADKSENDQVRDRMTNFVGRLYDIDPKLGREVWEHLISNEKTSLESRELLDYHIAEYEDRSLSEQYPHNIYLRELAEIAYPQDSSKTSHNPHQ